jgi:hypothetical protein
MNEINKYLFNLRLCICKFHEKSICTDPPRWLSQQHLNEEKVKNLALSLSTPINHYKESTFSYKL